MNTNCLRGLRKLKRLSQTEFAKKFYTSPQMVRAWEAGTRDPDHETMCKIAEYFNTSVDYIWGYTDK